MDLGTKQIKEKKENIRMKIKQSNILILAKEYKCQELNTAP